MAVPASFLEIPESQLLTPAPWPEPIALILAHSQTIEEESLVLVVGSQGVNLQSPLPL